MDKYYYKILGVEKNATDDELKKSFRKLAVKYHPDKQVGKSDSEKKDAELKFKEINEAYSVLSDKDKRSNYDRFGTADVNHGFGGGGFDPMSFFRSHMGGFGFGGGFGGFGDFGFDMGDFDHTRQDDPNAPKNGQNVRVAINVSFEESIYGTEKEFDIKLDDPCEHCHGTGSDDGQTTTCTTCGGSGMVMQKHQNGFMTQIVSSPCPTCNGSGVKITKPCHVCNGNGTVNVKRHVKLSIPQGIENDGVIKVNGNGIKGTNGGKDGDLLIIVKVSDNELFERNGINLYTTAYVSPIVAIMGGTVDVQTPWGVAKLKIQEHTESGKVYRLSGEGVKSNRGIGDLYIKIEVESLNNLSSEQKKILEELNKTIIPNNLKKTIEYTKKCEKFESSVKKFRK